MWGVKESILVPIYRKGDKANLVTREAYQLASYVQNFIQHPAVKCNSLYRGNCWVSSVWI